MEKSEITKRIYKLVRERQDSGLITLEILKLTEKQNLDEIIKQYKNILQGKTKVAEVLTKTELSADQKKNLEGKLTEKFSKIELIFDYIVSERNKPGIMIKLGDDLMDGSV